MNKTFSILPALILGLFAANPLQAGLNNESASSVSSAVRCDDPPENPPDGWFE